MRVSSSFSSKDALIGAHFMILEAKENEKVIEQRMERIIKGESLIFETETISEIDLLITDIMMPDLNGKELIRYIKTIKPSIKVIAISAHDIWNIGKRDSDIDVFVGKPFKAIYLLSVIGKVMGSQS